MNKFIYALFLASALGGVYAHAIQSVSQSVYQASFTATSDTMVQIPGTKPGSQLYGVIVGSTSTSGVLTIFDGQGGNSVSTITIVGLGVIQSSIFNVAVTSGITYTTSYSTNKSGVTILYRNPNVP